LRLLAFDTSGPSLSAAAHEGDRLVHRFEPLARGHAERLLPLLREVLAEAGWRWQDVGLVAVTLGPGNFTGLRAGIAVARALRLALGCRTLGVGTLEVIARSAAEQAGRRGLPIVAALDARRGEVYAQRFTADLVPLEPPAVLTREALLAMLEGRACVIGGDAAPWLPPGLHTVHEVVESGPDARYLVQAARRRLASDADPAPGAALRPLYIRPPDARPSAGASLVAAAR
jgi:tRNA threonylcarbamoyladenosine biosynthesis protein TsaB